jgi:hypothetical protein
MIAHLSNQLPGATCVQVKNLNLWHQGIADLGAVGRCHHLEVLSLAMNSVANLTPLIACRELRELYLRKNAVVDLVSTAAALSCLPQLRILWLEDCPVTADAAYMPLLLAVLPRLEKLDQRDVCAEQRQDARRTASADPGLRALMKQVQTAAAELVRQRGLASEGGSGPGESAPTSALVGAAPKGVPATGWEAPALPAVVVLPAVLLLLRGLQPGQLEQVARECERLMVAGV